MPSDKIELVREREAQKTIRVIYICMAVFFAFAIVCVCVAEIFRWRP